MSLRNLLFVAVGLIIGLIASTTLPLHARKRPVSVVVKTAVQDAPREIETRTEPASPVAAAPAGKVSLQDALHQPYGFMFGRRTAIAEVARRMTADLGGAVVLDLAALERLGVKPDDGVELELKGVRLKTGLKLLLDQLGMTYRLIPEDNLLIFTDREGSEDPLDQVWSELSHLHRDVHDIQDMVEDLYESSFEPDMEGGPRLRMPTIVEEAPGGPGGKPAAGEAPKPEAEAPPPATAPKRPRTQL